MSGKLMSEFREGDTDNRLQAAKIEVNSCPVDVLYNVADTFSFVVSSKRS